jgi:hypothetical protein
MRSLKEGKKENILNLKVGCYYEVELYISGIWLFKFEGYSSRNDNTLIISGETYCVSEKRYFSTIGTLCDVIDIKKYNAVKINIRKFRRVMNL